MALHRDHGLAAIAILPRPMAISTSWNAWQGQDQPALLKLYDSPKNDRRYNRLRQIAGEMNLPAHEVVLGYLLAQPVPTYAVIGARDSDQLQASLKAAGRRWPDDLAARLEADD